MRPKCCFDIKYKILPVSPQKEIWRDQVGWPWRPRYGTLFASSALEKFFIQVDSHISRPMWSSTILLENRRCSQIQDLRRSLKAKHLFVVFLECSPLRKEIRASYLSFVQAAPSNSRLECSRCFYESLWALLTPDFCITLADYSIGVKHASISEQDAVQVAGIILSFKKNVLCMSQPARIIFR